MTLNGHSELKHLMIRQIVGYRDSLLLNEVTASKKVSRTVLYFTSRILFTVTTVCGNQVDTYCVPLSDGLLSAKYCKPLVYDASGKHLEPLSRFLGVL